MNWGADGSWFQSSGEGGLIPYAYERGEGTSFKGRGAQSTYARPIILADGAMLVFHARIYYGQGSKFLRPRGYSRSAGGEEERATHWQ